MKCVRESAVKVNDGHFSRFDAALLPENIEPWWYRRLILQR